MQKLREEDPTRIGFFTRFILGICEREAALLKAGFQEIKAFGFLFREVRNAYLALKEDHSEGLDDSWRRIKRIMEAFYILDEGLTPGEELKPMERELGEDEAARGLQALDAGRLKFQTTLVEAFEDLHHMSDRNLLLSWARKTYYHVHCFQAPGRSDPRLAMRGAMGTSDHFLELAKEVIKESPQAIK